MDFFEVFLIGVMALTKYYKFCKVYNTKNTVEKHFGHGVLTKYWLIFEYEFFLYKIVYEEKQCVGYRF